MERQKLLLAGLAILFFLINYSWIDSFLIKTFSEQSMIGKVERVIDGDTLVIDGTSIRLLGINTPEKGELYSAEAKEFLESNVLNKTVKIKFGKSRNDRYNRILGYIFFKNENVNLKIVREGYANFYFPSGKDKYYSEFYSAWENCLSEEKRLCKSSQLPESKCVSVEKWGQDFEGIILKNNCEFKINLEGWSVKDEGRKKFIFGAKNLEAGERIILTPKDWGKKYIWTNTGDSIFLRDNVGGLVYFDNY